MKFYIELTIWAVDIAVHLYYGEITFKFIISFNRVKETWQRVRRLFKKTQCAN